MANTDDKLKSILYRTFCPESIELGEFQLGMSSSERSMFIRQHLGECPHCRRELNQLQSFLADLAPEIEYSLAERMKIWIAQLLPDLSEGGVGLAPAYGLRGDPEKLLFYQAGDAQLTIEMQDDAEQPGRRSLLGLVIGIDPEGLSAQLWQAGRQLDTAAVDELGNFVLPHLDTGTYELILSVPELEIHVQELAVK